MRTTTKEGGGEFCFFDNLPFEILLKIFDMMEPIRLCYVRGVNKRWKCAADTVGLLGIIDERGGRSRKQSFDFSSTHIIRETIIMNLELLFEEEEGENTFHYGYPDCLEIVSCVGPTNSYWFLENLITECQYITHLKLQGAFFSYLNLAINTQTNQVFQGLSRLKRLEISLKCEDILIVDPFSKYLTNLSRSQLHLDYLNTLDRNLSILLNGIRSHSLTTLILQIGIESVRNPPEFYLYNWRYKPLEKFLEFHSTTLQTILMPNFMGKLCMRNYNDEETKLPSNLKILNFRCQNFYFSDSRIWEGFLKNQTNLKRVAVKLIDFEPKTSCLIANCISLKNLNLNQLILQFGVCSLQSKGNPYQRMFIPIDGKIFEKLISLKKLVIECDAPKSCEISGILLNFSNLPKSLETITVTRFIIRNLQSNDILRLKNLKYISLNVVMLKSLNFHLFEYFEEDSINISNFIKSILPNHRKINFLHFTYWNSVPFSNQLIDMICTLRPIYSQNYKEWKHLQIRAIQFSQVLPQFCEKKKKQDLYNGFRFTSTDLLHEADDEESVLLYNSNKSANLYIDHVCNNYYSEDYDSDYDDDDDDDQEGYFFDAGTN